MELNHSDPAENFFNLILRDPSFLLSHLWISPIEVPMGSYKILYQKDIGTLCTSWVASCTWYGIYIPEFHIRILGHALPSKHIPIDQIFWEIKNETWLSRERVIKKEVRFSYVACPDSISNQRDLVESRYYELVQCHWWFFSCAKPLKITQFPDKYPSKFWHVMSLYLAQNGSLLLQNESKY